MPSDSTAEVLKADVTAEREDNIAVKEAETSPEKAGSDTTIQEASVEPNTSDEVVTPADTTAAAEVPAEPMDVEEEAVHEILEKAEDDNRDSCAASSGSCETVESWKEVEDEEEEVVEPSLSLEEEGCPPLIVKKQVAKEKKGALVTELVAADMELSGVLRTLRTKRRSRSGEAWHGWGEVEEAPR